MHTARKHNTCNKIIYLKFDRIHKILALKKSLIYFFSESQKNCTQILQLQVNCGVSSLYEVFLDINRHACMLHLCIFLFLLYFNSMYVFNLMIQTISIIYLCIDYIKLYIYKCNEFNDLFVKWCQGIKNQISVLKWNKYCT